MIQVLMKFIFGKRDVKNWNLKRERKVMVVAVTAAATAAAAAAVAIRCHPMPSDRKTYLGVINRAPKKYQNPNYQQNQHQNQNYHQNQNQEEATTATRKVEVQKRESALDPIQFLGYVYHVRLILLGQRERIS